MFVEMTRGRSDIYDILTHLTFLYIEAEKIRRNSINHRGEKKREWLMLEEAVKKEAANDKRIKEWRKQLFDLKGELQASCWRVAYFKLRRQLNRRD